jgi:hypothetical protein
MEVLMGLKIFGKRKKSKKAAVIAESEVATSDIAEQALPEVPVKMTKARKPPGAMRGLYEVLLVIVPMLAFSVGALVYTKEPNGYFNPFLVFMSVALAIAFVGGVMEAWGKIPHTPSVPKPVKAETKAKPEKKPKKGKVKEEPKEVVAPPLDATMEMDFADFQEA